MLEANTIVQGRYRIINQIGRGGMGIVYLAKDENLGVTVAVKQNFFDDQRLIEAFKRESRLLAGLRHPALPQVKDYFINEAGQFLVMEYIAGDDFGTILEKRSQGIKLEGKVKPFEVVEIVHWAEQLLDALDYLHTLPEPVIHRDIKPQNLKLAGRNQIILLDFGLAKGKPLWMTRVTTTGSIYGYTLNYAPLEQIRGGGTDPRSDLYALGATLYHLITGVPPADAASRAEMVLSSEPDPLRPANEVNPQVPRDVAEVLGKAMEQARNNRPATAIQMLEMLRAVKLSTVIDRRPREAEIVNQSGSARPKIEIETPASTEAEQYERGELTRKQREEAATSPIQNEQTESHRRAEIEAVKRAREAKAQEAATLLKQQEEKEKLIVAEPQKVLRNVVTEKQALSSTSRFRKIAGIGIGIGLVLIVLIVSMVAIIKKSDSTSAAQPEIQTDAPSASSPPSDPQASAETNPPEAITSSGRRNQKKQSANKKSSSKSERQDVLRPPVIRRAAPPARSPIKSTEKRRSATPQISIGGNEDPKSPPAPVVSEKSKNSNFVPGPVGKSNSNTARSFTEGLKKLFGGEKKKKN